MSEIEREPCPHCGELAPLSARVCPRCRGNLLYDVIVDLPPPDPRARYQAARTVSSLGSAAPAFLDIQRALGQSGSLLAAGVTREAARRLARTVEEHGGRTRFSGHQQPLPAARPGPSWPRIAAAVALCVGAAGIGLFAWSRATSAPPEAPPTLAPRVGTADAVLSTREIAERATASTVKLRCPRSEGTGFFVTRNLLVTNAHVLCTVGQIKAVFADGRELYGTVMMHDDDELDLAFVHVPRAAARPLPLGDATSLQTGDRVVFIGTPRGLDFTVHEGIVSHSIRSLFGVGYLQIDANVNAGNSGGPLFDTQGRVVGIVSAKVAEADGLGFVLPINYALGWMAPPLMPAPVPAPDRAAWARVLAQIEKTDRQEVIQALSEGSRPALMGLAMIPGRGPAARVLRVASAKPSAETLSFIFRNQERILCTVYSPVSGWERQGRGASSTARSKYLRWLERNGLGGDLYQALAPLDLTFCPTEELKEAEIVLDGGDEHADRLAL
jgi:serine protease Do